MYRPFAIEKLVQWSVPEGEPFIRWRLLSEEEKHAIMSCEEPSSSRTTPSPYPHCMEASLSSSEVPPRPLVQINRPVHADSFPPALSPSSFVPWRFKSGWADVEDDHELWTEEKQLRALGNFSLVPLHKECFPGLQGIIGYEGRIVPAYKEVPALAYEPCVSPSPDPECPNAPTEGIVLHHGLRPRTRVPPGYSLWSDHATMDRRFLYTIPLNQIEYEVWVIFLGSLFLRTDAVSPSTQERMLLA